jgi:isopenicillin N synthase-like dioxygenase
MSNFPLIDLGGTSEPHTASHQRTALQLRQALEHVGFFAVVNHGISPALIDDIFSQARRFHALPAEQKAALVFSPDFTGYVPPARHVLRTSTVNDNTMGDLNAAFFMEREEPPDGADGVRAKQFRPDVSPSNKRERSSWGPLIFAFVRSERNRSRRS